MSHVGVYKRLPVKIVKGEGAWVYDAEGRAFLDMYGGHAVASTGHGHPRLVKALREQVGKLLFYSNAVGLEHQDEAAALLVAELPEPLARVFFCNTGTEAVENALKVARKATGRTTVLSFEGGFHGRTLGALSATGLGKYRSGAGLAIPGNVFAPFGDLAAVEAALAAQPIAAVLVEPVQSLAGVKTAPAEFFQGLRALCDEHGTLLIYDELQTGVGRTGSWFFAPKHGVVPDLLTLGKGLASGVPMAATVMTAALGDALKPGDLGTTFGGGPLACLALKTTLEILRDEGVVERVAANADGLAQGIAGVPGVTAVRGLGYLLGVVVPAGAAKVQAALLRHGVLAGTSEDPAVLRLMPPLTLGRTEIDTFVARLAAAMGEVSHGA